MTTAPRPSGDVITWIFTDRLDECRTFWTDVMGMTIEVTWDDDTGRGTMWRISETALLEMKHTSADVEPPNFRLAIEFATAADVDEWFKFMIAAGVETLDPPTDQHYGHHNASVRDPAGLTVICFSRIR